MGGGNGGGGPGGASVGRSTMATFLADFKRKAVRKRMTRELFLCNFPFLCLFLFFVLGAHDIVNQYEVQNSIQSAFEQTQYYDGSQIKAFFDGQQTADIWNWIQDILVNQAWPSTTYTGASLAANQKGYASNYNKLLGALRVRQDRVAPVDCTPLPQYKMSFVTEDPLISEGKCYPDMSESAKATSWEQPLSAAVLASSVAEAFQYRSYCSSASPTGDLAYYWGQTLNFYPMCSGFYIDIAFDTLNSTQVLAIFNDLQNFGWIDRFTAIIFLEFYSYNANLNIFQGAKYIYEMPASGDQIPQTQYRTFSFNDIRGWEDIVSIALQGLFGLFIVAFLVQMLVHWFQTGWKFFLNFWNLMDLVNLSFFTSMFGIRLAWFIQANYTWPVTITATQSYPENLEYYASLQLLESELLAFNSVLCFMRTFKYLQLNDRLNLLGRTLSEATGDLAGFMVIFTVVFLGYSLLAYMAYGSSLQAFNTFPAAAATLFQILLGNFDYDSMRSVNRILTPIFFLSYVAIVLFVLMNMFISILNDSYSKANEKSQEKSFVEMIRHYFKKRRERKRLLKQAAIAEQFVGSLSASTSRSKADDARQRHSSTDASSTATVPSATTSSDGGDSVSSRSGAFGVSFKPMDVEAGTPAKKTGDPTRSWSSLASVAVAKFRSNAGTAAATGKKFTDDELYHRLQEYVTKYPDREILLNDLRPVLGVDVPLVEVERIRRKLMRFDVNSDNRIDASEFTAAMDDHQSHVGGAGQSPTPASAVSLRGATPNAGSGGGSGAGTATSGNSGSQMRSDDAAAAVALLYETKLQQLNEKLNRLILVLSKEPTGSHLSSSTSPDRS